MVHRRSIETLASWYANLQRQGYGAIAGLAAAEATGGCHEAGDRVRTEASPVRKNYPTLGCGCSAGSWGSRLHGIKETLT